MQTINMQMICYLAGVLVLTRRRLGMEGLFRGLQKESIA
jgi:hypothetical protein